MNCYKVECVETNTYMFCVDTKLYEKDAVINTIYKYSQKVSFKLEDNGNGILVFIVFKETMDVEGAKRFVNDFYNELTDQQLRLSLDNRTGYIKKLIYERAFSVLKVSK